MSAKFQQETVRDAPIPGSRKDGLAHNIGERLTGGATTQGYLAVSSMRFATRRFATDGTVAPGLSAAASGQPPSHKDAYVGLAGRSARGPRFMDRERRQQTWPLHQLPSAQDGRLWRLH